MGRRIGSKNKNTKTVTVVKEPEIPKKRRAYQRAPLNIDVQRDPCLQPLLDILLKENISISELAQRLGMSRSGLSYRFLTGNCSMKDMDQIGEAIGYDFTWKMKKKKVKNQDVREEPPSSTSKMEEEI